MYTRLESVNVNVTKGKLSNPDTKKDFIRYSKEGMYKKFSEIK